MSPDPARAAIAAVVDAAARQLPEVEWYGFGSFFRRDGPYGDIDLLAVCPSATDVRAVRHVLFEACANWPIDLTVMERGEADATDFVAGQGCQRLAGPDHSEAASG